jgi:hypothetical protein
MATSTQGHTIGRNTFVGTPKVTGGIWLVPQNVALPTDATSERPPEAVRLGGVSDEGYTYSEERSTDKKMDWNGDKVRSLQTSKDDSFEITFIEFLNPAVMGVLYGSDNVTVTPATATAGTEIAVRHVSDQLEHGSYIIDTFDGKTKRRRVIPDAQPATIEPIVEKPGDWSVYKVKFDIYPDSQGVTSYSYTVLDDATGTTPLAAGAKGETVHDTAKAANKDRVAGVTAEDKVAVDDKVAVADKAPVAAPAPQAK